MLTDKNRIQISTEEELNTLVNRFLYGPPFAVAFEFANDEYFYRFLTSVGINTKEFNNKILCLYHISRPCKRAGIIIFYT